ncbi:polysaccharide export protein [Roseomonas sp. OT10]|uniref:polysaccharide biosynthesis/export family protein n=1 Tax=Roseomonas cutis TaxID=2897332 RepID=UPI001E5B8E85|nr:polysaccharide biosynthesis/export family protein [Roseomonas sp. OT10]UFN50480.1 polysaccharide export protein [Roseomonas sp. OT10]
MNQAIRITTLLGALATAGCNTVFLPRSGPTQMTMVNGAEYRLYEEPGASSVPYALMPLTPRLITRLEAEERRPLFTGSTLSATPTDLVIGIGDVVAVTIFESQSGGLFIPSDAGARSGNFVQLPAQQVDASGTITVPFGGSIRAAGLTPVQLQRSIEGRLSRRALEPQAVVTLTERRSNNISVLGEVMNSQRFPLDPQGDRLLSAIARAGGPKFPAYETMVTLQRGGRIERALLGEIGVDPEQNIALRPGDVIVVTREPRYFTALGAMGQTNSVSQINRRFSFDDTRLSMADAVGRAGGLTDDRADPQAVFLFRYETPQMLRNAGLSLPPEVTEPVPTVYQADFLNPGAFFMANRFPMRHGDVMFTSNAPATQLSKFLNLILPGATSSSSIRSAVN